MSKHTPKPWDVEPNSGYVYKNGARHPTDIDETREPGESWLAMRERTAPLRALHEAECMANARLKAAAPEMLEVLYMLDHDLYLAHEGKYCNLDNFNSGTRTVRKKIKDLIAKAKGVK